MADKPFGSVLRHVPRGAQLLLVTHWARHAVAVAGRLDGEDAARFERFTGAVERQAVGAGGRPGPATIRRIMPLAAAVGDWLNEASRHFDPLPLHPDGFAQAVRQGVWAVRRACSGDDWSQTADRVLRSIDRAKPPTKAALRKLPDFRTAAVVELAESLWRTLDPHVAAVLADALEEAGLPAALVAPYRAEPGSLTRADWLFWHLGCERLGVSGETSPPAPLHNGEG